MENRKAVTDLICESIPTIRILSFDLDDDGFSMSLWMNDNYEHQVIDLLKGHDYHVTLVKLKDCS